MVACISLLLANAAPQRVALAPSTRMVAPSGLLSSDFASSMDAAPCRVSAPTMDVTRACSADALILSTTSGGSASYSREVANLASVRLKESGISPSCVVAIALAGD